MTAPGTELSDQDFARIARLHRVSLDDSLPSFLGESYLTRFYRHLAASDLEHLLTHRSAAEIDSVCVLSFAPATMQRRAMRSTLVPLGVSATLAWFRDPAFRSLVRRMIRSPSRVEGEPPGAPEITHIFTDPRLRGRNMGRLLLERVDQHLRERGVPVCYVRTIDDADNRALAFYERNGYSRVGRTFSAGGTFVVFKKVLAAR